jgi:hypothetical protein
LHAMATTTAPAPATRAFTPRTAACLSPYLARESPKKRLSRISLSPTNSSPRTRRLFGQWSEHDR